jgi:hypothetical protein
LFNLTRSDCPECGEAYDIDRYRFAPGSVSFHCPHCSQAYQGNDPQGLPWPREFRCAECGNVIRLQQMRVVPITPDAVGWAGSVWDNRERLGFWKAWWQTLGAVLFHPARFFRNHRGASTGEACLFSLVCLYIGLLGAVPVQLLIMASLTAAIGAGPGGGTGVALPFPVWFLVVISILGALIGPLLIVFVYGALWSLLIQLALLILVPHRKSLGYTFRAVLYSFGVYALSAIPLCGGQAAGIWVFVTLINGIKEVHHSTGGRAAAAVLWPLITGIVLYFTIIAVVFIYAVS